VKRWRRIGDPTYRKNGRTAAGRAIERDRARRESEAAVEKDLADKLAALLATAPKPDPLPAPPEPIVAAPEPTPEPAPAPVVERELTRAEQVRIAQLAKDITVDVFIEWERIQRAGQQAGQQTT